MHSLHSSISSLVLSIVLLSALVAAVEPQGPHPGSRLSAVSCVLALIKHIAPKLKDRLLLIDCGKVGCEGLVLNSNTEFQILWAFLLESCESSEHLPGIMRVMRVLRDAHGHEL
jgi:hypothetical protein